MKSISWLGVVLILLGLALVVTPFLGRYFSLEDMPSWLLYVYRRDGFYFVTSPLLLILSLAVFLLHFFKFV